MRTISDAEIRVLTGATDADYALGGGVSLFEMFTRVRVSTLSKYASNNEEHSESLMPIDVAIEADRFAKSPVIVTAMAKLLGFRLVPEDAPRQRRPVSSEDSTIVLSETMDVAKALIDALRDGKIDAADRRSIIPEINEAIRALEQLRDNLTGE